MNYPNLKTQRCQLSCIDIAPWFSIKDFNREFMVFYLIESTRDV